MESQLTILDDGSQEWRNSDGELHREHDKPAAEYANGTKFWCINGDFYREGDKPAVEEADGRKEWWRMGKPYWNDKTSYHISQYMNYRHLPA